MCISVDIMFNYHIHATFIDKEQYNRWSYLQYRRINRNLHILSATIRCEHDDSFVCRHGDQ